MSRDDCEEFYLPNNQHFRESGKVIAITGKWGEGKTSLIKLILGKLTEKDQNANRFAKCISKMLQRCGFSQDNNLKIIEWDPWYFPAKADLSEQLYKIIQPSSTLLDKLKKFGFYILFFAVVALIYLLFTLVFQYLNPTRCGIAVIIAFWLFRNKGLHKIYSILELVSWIIQTPNHINYIIESKRFQFNSIQKTLKKMTKDRKLLIVIDDIDRMEDRQIKQILDLTNGIGKLPNILYLIAFDKIIVSKAINLSNPGEGERYLDKIIQVHIPLYYTTHCEFCF